MNNKGYISLPRELLVKEKELTDQEFRLFMVYVRLAGWDSRYESYGKIKISYAEMKKHLPRRSRQSIGNHTNGLIRKGFVKRFPDQTLEIMNFEVYARPKRQHPGHSVQPNGRSVKTDGQPGLSLGQVLPPKLADQYEKLKSNKGFP